MEYVTLGQIVNVRGIKGEVKIMACTDFPKERYKVGNELVLENEQTHDVLTVHVQSHQRVGDCDFVVFKEITTPEDATKYRSYYVQYPVAELKPLKAAIHYRDLQGMQVYEDGVLRGTVKGFKEGAQLLLIVQGAKGKTTLVPFVSAFVQDVNTADKVVTLKHWEGLFDEN